MSKVNFLPFDCICRFWAFCNLKIAATKAWTVATAVATEHSKLHEWRSFDAIDVVSLNASMPIPSYSIQLNCIVCKRKVSIDRLQRMCTRSNEKSLTKIYILQHICIEQYFYSNFHYFHRDWFLHIYEKAVIRSHAH